MLRFPIFKPAPGVLAAHFQTCGTATKMDAGCLIEPTIFVAAMINPVVEAGGGQVTIGDVLPVRPNLLHPLWAARISAGLLAASSTLWIFCVVPFEKLIGIAVDAIKHSAREHQVDVRVAFFVVQPPGMWMLITTYLPNVFSCSRYLLIQSQLAR